MVSFVVLLVVFLVQNKIAQHDALVKNTTNEMLKYSQQTLKNVSLVKDTLEDLNYKKEVLAENLDKIKKFSVGQRTAYNEFKVIEPE